MLTRVKVCGICRREDAQLAVELGAAAIGFVFWPQSPRCIAPDIARAIARTLPDDVMTVGVFVDQPPSEVMDIVGTVGLDAIQLHGSENAAEYAGVGSKMIKAIPVAQGFDAAVVDALPDDVTPLLDAHDPVRRGGTGKKIDWSIAAAVAGRRETILSGGLNPRNVAEALACVRPAMLDVSSGVEEMPRRKDPAKLREFFSAIRRASVNGRFEDRVKR